MQISKFQIDLEMVRAVMMAALLHGGVLGVLLGSNVSFSAPEKIDKRGQPIIFETVWEEPEPKIQPKPEFEPVLEEEVPVAEPDIEKQIIVEKEKPRIEPAPTPVQKIKPPDKPKPRAQKVVANPISKGVPRPVFVGAQAVKPQKKTEATYPAYLKNPKPIYPKSARKRKLEGLVLLKVTVSEKGLVVSIKLHKSCGHRKLDQSALKTVRGWRFLPAQTNGLTVQSTVIVPIRFSLKELG